MLFRFTLLVAATMLLSSCWWIGPAFYKGDPADAAPLKPGLYKMDALGDGQPGEKIRVSWLPDGSVAGIPLKLGKDERTEPFVMVRLALPGRDLWITQLTDNEDEKTYAYGLAELHGTTLAWTPLIDCEPTAAIVRAAGGEVEDDAAMNVEDADTVPATNSMQEEPPAASGKRMGGTVCRFKDRASLERALRAYVATNPRWLTRTRFKRIGD